MLELEDRMIKENSPYPLLNEMIDYSRVNKLLNEQRMLSYDFLKNAIDGE